MRVHDIVSYAIGRAHIVFWSEIRKRPSEILEQSRVLVGDRSARRASPQTPMSQTPSNPWDAIASHSAAGTRERSTVLPYFRVRSFSHTQVLISNNVGYGLHV